MTTPPLRPPLRIGIAGLGMAGAVMIHAARAHPGIALAGAADPNPAPRDAFTRDTGAPAYDDIAALCADPAIEAIYIATPHQFHAPHAILAAQAGKHLIIEKPLALTLADCDAIIEAVDRAGIHCIVGHTHAFDPQIRLLRRLIEAGTYGRLGMLALWNYTDYLYRPRRPEELDTAKGGGILFNQIPHQIDIVRLLGGGTVRSVRAITQIMDPTRPTEGMATALLQMANGAAATLTYSGHDFFDADELHHWIAESGAPKTPSHGAARRALAARTEAETALRTSQYAYGAPFALRPHQPHFGFLIASCANADLRPSPDGVTIYDQSGAHEHPIELAGIPGRHQVLDDLIAAVRLGVAPLQAAGWGRATLEVALAIQHSAKTGAEIVLQPRN